MKSSANSTASVERFALLRLIRSENVGPITVRQLLDRFGTAEAALAALPELARRGGRRRPIKVASRDEAQRELAALEACGAEALALTDKAYPRALAAIPDAPPVLAVLGHPHLLERRAVAVVGARNASANGRRLAERLATDLGQNGYLVVSGLARGIDTAAHRGALASGTAAVVAGGVDVVYPEENRALYENIKEKRCRALRDAAWHRTPGPSLPTAQPDYLGTLSWRSGGRGCAPLRLPDHRATRARAEPGDFRRAGFAAGPAGKGLQPPNPPGRNPGGKRPRRARGS